VNQSPEEGGSKHREQQGQRHDPSEPKQDKTPPYPVVLLGNPPVRVAFWHKRIFLPANAEVKCGPAGGGDGPIE
jgi:hypothetical protein